MSPSRIIASYEIVTPMFCGGANQEAEFRLSSFKGVLRWWWRALAWSKYNDLETIKSEEDKLFGSAQRGRGQFTLRVVASSIDMEVVAKGTVLKNENTVVGEGARYFGYGVMEAYGSTKKKTESGQLTRECIIAPFAVTIELRMRNSDCGNQTLLQSALKAMGLLGGMGARSRRGYGSLVLQSLMVDDKLEWEAPKTVTELKSEIEKLTSNLNHVKVQGEVPPYTALCRKTRIVLVELKDKSDKRPLALLDCIGREMVRYRSWGRTKNGETKVLGEIPSEKYFKDDHDFIKGFIVNIDYPRRVAFGLPYNFGKGAERREGSVLKKNEKQQVERRASPLLIHIHMCETHPVAVLSFLPSRFYPKNKIKVGSKKVALDTSEKFWKPIHDFLDRLLERNKDQMRKEPFGEALEVKI